MEVMEFDEKIWRAANGKKLGKIVFKPLHQSDHQKFYIDSKAYGPYKKSWLRLYAIRLAKDLYVITGGGIKLTRAMTSKELKKELLHLNIAKKQLINQGVLIAHKGDSGYFELKNKL